MHFQLSDKKMFTMEIAVDGLDDVDLLVINLTSRNSAMMSK